MSLKKRNVAFHVDIETAGPALALHPLQALGWTVQDTDSWKILEVSRTVLPLQQDEKTNNKETMEWQQEDEKRKEVFAQLAKEARTTVVEALEVFCKRVQHYKDQGDNVYVVSDNPAFDGGFVDLYLQKYKGFEVGLAQYFAPEGTYRRMYQNDAFVLHLAQLHGLRFLQFTPDDLSRCKSIAKARIGPNHFPDVDALCNAHYVMEVFLFLEKKSYQAIPI